MTKHVNKHATHIHYHNYLIGLSKLLFKLVSNLNWSKPHQSDRAAGV